jgi:hypothetical protein
MSPPQSLICLRALPADASEFVVRRIPSLVESVSCAYLSECVRSLVLLARSSARLGLSVSSECNAGRRQSV